MTRWQAHPVHARPLLDSRRPDPIAVWDYRVRVGGLALFLGTLLFLIGFALWGPS